MNIYHGSKVIIKEPKVKGSNPTNDYGPSFYLTVDLSAAKSWACRQNSVGIVNKYRFDSKAFKRLKILDLTNKDKYSVLNWMAILMHFRYGVTACPLSELSLPRTGRPQAVKS